MKLSDGNVSENLTETLKIEITDKVHNLGNIHIPKLTKYKSNSVINII